MASDCPYFCIHNIADLHHRCRHCKAPLMHEDCDGKQYGTCNECAELLAREGI